MISLLGREEGEERETQRKKGREREERERERELEGEREREKEKDRERYLLPHCMLCSCRMTNIVIGTIGCSLTSQALGL